MAYSASFSISGAANVFQKQEHVLVFAANKNLQKARQLNKKLIRMLMGGCFKIINLQAVLEQNSRITLKYEIQDCVAKQKMSDFVDEINNDNDVDILQCSNIEYRIKLWVWCSSKDDVQKLSLMMELGEFQKFLKLLFTLLFGNKVKLTIYKIVEEITWAENYFSELGLTF